MIQITGIGTEQISLLTLSDVEKDIVKKKQNSPVMYHYDSLEALQFELNMRTGIVEAAKAIHAGGARFATFKNTRCNKLFWSLTDNGGFQLKRDVLPSEGIQDIFQNGKLYAFECAAAVVIILYKATLDAIHKETFNANFKDLFIWDWNYDSNLQLTSADNSQEAYPGDVLYFKNPDYAPSTPEWQGENVIMLADDLYFGHGIGVHTAKEMIEALNKARKPGSQTSAFLSDDVIHPNFEYLRQLHTKGDHPITPDGYSEHVVVARIGTRTYIQKKKK